MILIHDITREIHGELLNENGYWDRILTFDEADFGDLMKLNIELESFNVAVLKVFTICKGMEFEDRFYFEAPSGKLIYSDIHNTIDTELSMEYEFLLEDRQPAEQFTVDLIHDYFLTRPQYRWLEENFESAEFIDGYLVCQEDFIS